MKRRRQEGGFAMLLVFLMAAIIAISLYNEIPRVSFESQRAKEQLLIERGEQYQRAIKVFVRANKRYPASIQELESLSNHRYLRKQYIDPMTGKKEWRIIHIGPGGVFTDSLVNKPKNDQDKDKEKKGDTTTTTQNTTDPNNPTGQPQAPSALPPRRQSEMAGAPGQPGYGAPPQIDPATGQPIVQTGIPGQQGVPGSVYPTGVPGYPGQPVQPGQVIPGQPYPMQPGQVPPGQPYPTAGQVQPYQPYPAQPGQVIPGQPYPAQPGQVIPGQPYPAQPGQPVQPGAPGYPYSTVPGAQGSGTVPFQQPGMTPATAGGPASPTDAQKMIQDLLTRPRSSMPTSASPVGQQIGGGIAGVASNADAEGIKLYNDKTNYKEWEFIYDYTKDKGPAATTGGIGTPAQQLGSTPGQPLGTAPGQAGTAPTQTGPQQMNTPFGQIPATTSPGFGSPVQQPGR
jgi:hypothetical protein